MSATPSIRRSTSSARRVAGAAGADDAVLAVAEAADDGGRVEVAVRDEDGRGRRGAAPRPRTSGPATVKATVGVRGALGRRAVERDAVDRVQARSTAARRAPGPARGARRSARTRRVAAVGPVGERGQEVHRGRGPHDALVVLGARLEPVGGVLGRGLELGQVEALDRAPAGPRGRRRAGRRTCRPSRRGSRRRGRRRRRGRAARSGRRPRRRGRPARGRDRRRGARR